MPVPLSSLRAGQRAVIDSFTEIDPDMQRLMQMGVLEGSDVEIVRFAPSGDPIELKVMGYTLSLRREQASLILVDDVS